MNITKEDKRMMDFTQQLESYNNPISSRVFYHSLDGIQWKVSSCYSSPSANFKYKMIAKKWAKILRKEFIISPNKSKDPTFWVLYEKVN